MKKAYAHFYPGVKVKVWVPAISGSRKGSWRHATVVSIPFRDGREWRVILEGEGVRGWERCKDVVLADADESKLETPVRTQALIIGW